MRAFGLLKWLAIIVYGILLPVYLLFFAINSHFQMLGERQRSVFIEKMEHRLDRLASYHRDEVFFHGLLQENFVRADLAGEPIEELKKTIDRLKSRFPGGLKFIVADADGQIDKKNSDEIRFVFIVKAMFKIIARLKSCLDRDLEIIPERDEQIAAKIGLLRSYFGQFLMEKHLLNPLLKGYLGSCIKANQDPDKSLLWYQHLRHFSLIVFVNESLMARKIGPKLICEDNNRRDSLIKLGLYDPQKFTVSGIHCQEGEINEIGIRAGEFLLSAIPVVETARFLMVFRHVAPDLVLLCLLKKSEGLLDPLEESKRAFWLTVKWLIIIVFLIYCFSLRFQRFFLTIRQKLLLLFLFVNGIPLLMLVSTGYEFFEQKKQSMINSINNQSARFLKDFDNRYQAYISELSDRLNDYIGKQKGLSRDKADLHAIRELGAFLRNLKPDESYLYLEEDEKMLDLNSDSLAPSGFFRDFFKNTLKVFNHSEFVPIERKKTSLEMISDDTLLFSGFLENTDRLFPQNFGSGNLWTYVRLIGDRANYGSWGFLVVAWKPETLMKRFFVEQIERVNAAVKPRKLIVMLKESETMFPPEYARVGKLKSMLRRTWAKKMINDQNLQVDGKAWAGSSIVGIELENAVLLSLYPLASVEQALSDLYAQIKLAALVSLIFVILILRLFSGRFNRPLEMLSAGMKEISRRNFSHKIDFSSEDEFGQLITGFNDAIDGMKELAVGTAVQESLLPESKKNFGHMRLFAKSIFMNRMGGDYFDYFTDQKANLSIFFGDVAGHGIPAAVLMAMAKGGIAANRGLGLGPAGLLEKINAVFLHLKSRGWRRMMTGLALELNIESGQFVCANAGHCYPIIVAPGGRDIRYIKAVGMPLGNKSRKPYAQIEDRLERGETLVLYTDGIIEATSADGEVFDFSRFENLLKNAWNEDLELYWQNIIVAYNAWIVTQDDDVSFMMVRHEE